MNKLLNYEAKAKINSELAKEKVKEEEWKECTFTPQLTTKAKSTRSLSQFLADQNNFLKKKRNSLIELTDITQNRIPKINNNSIVLAKKKNRPGSIYDHLYNRSKKSMALSEETVEQPKSAENIASISKISKSGSNSKVIQGFNKEFERAVEESNLNYRETITFYEMLLILTKMRLIKGVNKIPKKIYDLIEKLWLTIKLSNEDLVPVNTLKIYIAAILKIEPQSSKDNIAQEYAPLYWNRKSNKEQREIICEYSFKPILCKESLIMADELKKKSKIKEGSNKKSKEVPNECTFRPKINTYKRSPLTSRLKERVYKKNNLKEEEYKKLEEPQRKNAKAKRQSSVKGTNTDKYKGESSYKVKDIMRQPSDNEKTILHRGLSENKPKEKLKPDNDLNEEAITKNNEPLNEEKDESQLEILLYIDVTYKGSKKRITVRNGDTAKEVTDRFALENGNENITIIGINEKKKVRLEKMINAHIRLLAQNNELQE